MRYGYILFALILTGFGMGHKSIAEEKPNTTCDFNFNGLQPCLYDKNVSAISAELQIVPSNISKKRKVLTTLIIKRDGKTHALQISPDTTLMKRNVGYISFKDINFDGSPDIAITTSFGVANLYLDYWVYIPTSNSYKKIGNYSVFELDASTKTISTTTKINAATYEHARYKWDKYKLIKIPK